MALRGRDVLVLTATITPPPNVFQLARRDPAVRLQDYLRALAFYLGEAADVFDRVLYFENSDSDLSQLRRVAEESGREEQVEFVRLDCNDFPSEWGRGYGEFRMLDIGLERVGWLEPADRVWKVSGRLRLLNIESLVKRRPARFDLYCDLRDVPFIGDSLGGNKWMEMRCWASTVAFYDEVLRGRYHMMKHREVGGSAERYMYRCVREIEHEYRVVPRFRKQPIFAGNGGKYDEDYQSLKYRSKNAIRRVTRCLAPGLWI